MDDLKMNKQLGTKWFTFYTKVRPWLACLSVFGILSDFLKNAEIYKSFWWLMLYLFVSIAQPLLALVVFVKSQGDYEDFVRFVKGVLIFETISLAYGQAVQQYIQNGFNADGALLVGLVLLILAYFIWYRLNMKYFTKRLIVTTSDNFINVEENQEISAKKVEIDTTQTTNYQNKNVFCRKCGNKLFEDSQFCTKCGTKIIDNK